MRILVTGAAGFIGHHVVKALIARGDKVMGIDLLSGNYALKVKRLASALHPNFTFKESNIWDWTDTADATIHLAALAGVRESLKRPDAYTHSNIVCFQRLLRHVKGHLVFASSSSVYGDQRGPMIESATLKPISHYAATKVAGEAIAQAWHHQTGIPVTSLRFFTVYGPLGRPDMAADKFMRAIADDNKIDVYDMANQRRDFTYIDDVVRAILLALDSAKGHRVYNVGGGNPVALSHFIKVIEDAVGKKARINHLPMQPGDVRETYCSPGRIQDELGWRARVRIEEGIRKMVETEMEAA